MATKQSRFSIPSGSRVSVDRVRTAEEAGHDGLGDAGGEAGCDCGVGGATAVGQDLGAGLRGRRMTGRDARPHGRRMLLARGTIAARRLVPCATAPAAAVSFLAPCGDCGVRLKKEVTLTLTKEEKQEAIGKHGRNESDTGSTEVQVAMLTQRISQLTSTCAATLATTTRGAGS